MSSNATLIFNAATEKLQNLLGDKYKPLMNQFAKTPDEEAAPTLEHGFKILLGKFSGQKSPANVLLIERELEIEVTHRVFAARNSAKVVTKLQTAYDLEAAIISEFNAWQDSEIKLLKVLPTAEGEIEQDKDGEEQYLISKVAFKIQYFN